MENANKYFIGTYTARPKRYCDQEFFDSLRFYKQKGAHVEAVVNDWNADALYHYKNRIDEIAPWLNERHSLILDGGEHYFQRAVAESVELLRKSFLNTDCRWFVTVESDIIPPDNMLELFESVAEEADIIGGVYYRGHHKDEWFGEDHSELIDVNCFSGCTAYYRTVMEKLSFRWDEKDPRIFPDSFMDYDAREAGFKTRLFTGIKCEHLAKPNGSRGHEEVVWKQHENSF